MAVVAMNTTSKERIDITPFVTNKQVIWKVPEGNWKIMVFYCTPGGRVISLKVLQKIKAYYDNGGKVIATTLLPSKSAEFGHDKLLVCIVIFQKDFIKSRKIRKIEDCLSNITESQ